MACSFAISCATIQNKQPASSGRLNRVKLVFAGEESRWAYIEEVPEADQKVARRRPVATLNLRQIAGGHVGFHSQRPKRQIGFSPDALDTHADLPADGSLKPLDLSLFRFGWRFLQWYAPGAHGCVVSPLMPLKAYTLESHPCNIGIDKDDVTSTSPRRSGLKSGRARRAPVCQAWLRCWHPITASGWYGAPKGCLEICSQTVMWFHGQAPLLIRPASLSRRRCCAPLELIWTGCNVAQSVSTS
jgi:hypothetical protein